MYRIKNNLSGFLTTPLSDAQKLFLEINKEALTPTPTGADGNLYYKEKIIVNYADIKGPGMTALQGMTEIGRIQFDNFSRVVYRDNKTGADYIDMGNISPLLVRLVKTVEPPRSNTPPTTDFTPDIPTQSQDPNCPCDCSKQTVVEKVYLSPVRVKNSDTPVKLKTNKRICKSKDNQTQYMFDCNTSISEINRQLNLNGLADCPCDCTDQLVEQTYYITDAPCPNCIPFDVRAEKIICNDTDEVLNKRIDCNDLKEGLRQRGYTGLADRFDCMVSDNRLMGIDESYISANNYLVPKMVLGLIAGSLIIKLIRK